MKKFLNLLPNEDGFAVIPGELFEDGKALLICQIEEWAFFQQEGESEMLVYNKVLEVEVAVIEMKSDIATGNFNELAEEIKLWYHHVGKEALRKGIAEVFIETLGEDVVKKALYDSMSGGLENFFDEVLSDTRIN